ncbi:hypothetical protein M011DRAFT_499798 [Sporormia fimetaria CBS 119925]|uniref:Uncharacterized protein n=1 Tax=Sporormia fimetaria CBS 119925 TaxID=1340428 RepID=A0A6A6VF74_9PLEO|nr:hypothetical protein M011DRAFT_499798 [Sporormia fimetaria CBS 119925]
MGRWQPYQYQPQRNSVGDQADNFNPKAVTMASYQPPSPRKQTADGPLIDFNRHPDSYFVLQYGKSDAKPMNPKVQVWIKITRWIQLFFRVLTLFGAVGVLLCAIFIKGAQNTEGYIIRIPPGVDMVHCLYAVYHLLRSAKSRPAGSSASYHFFALVMDAGFIPLYVFTALLSKRNHNEPAGTDGRWRTVFPTGEETDTVLQTAWLAATAVGGLHIASLLLDLYLLIVFRKISKLPPDMNPLEENLTSRRKAKHKHKSSSVTTITELTGDDKRFSIKSGATTLVGDRNSQTDPLISEKMIPAPDETRMAFMRTRTNSNSGMTYSPHTPNSARHSRLYSQPPTASQSHGETLAQRRSFLTHQSMQRGLRPDSTNSSNQEFYTPPTTAGTHRSTGDISQEKVHSDNWVVHDGGNDEPEVPAQWRQRGRQANASKEKSSMFGSNSAHGYKALSPYDDMSDGEFEPPVMPQPLGMNPPTPPPAKAMLSSADQAASESKAAPPPLKRTLTVTTLSSEATFSRSLSQTSSPKTRYYGDLKAATESIRKGANSTSGSPTKMGTVNGLPSSTKYYTSNAPMPKTIANPPFSLDKKTFTSVRRTGEAGHVPVKVQSPRVVSRTGVDYNGHYDFADEPSAGRRREVSGKIAEEGRGGVFDQGPLGTRALTHRKVSGVA